MHEWGVIHWDIKPENIFIVDSDQVKIGDFGVAWSKNPERPLTGYVSTRWYRAPEIILGLEYSTKIDIWSAGLIMAELYNFGPLISGKSAEDQLYWILAIVGAPTEESWKEGFDKL